MEECGAQSATSRAISCPHLPDCAVSTMQEFSLFVARLCATGANFQELSVSKQIKTKQAELFVCCSMGRTALYFWISSVSLAIFARDTPHARVEESHGMV
jgi:hypothetical protein